MRTEALDARAVAPAAEWSRWVALVLFAGAVCGLVLVLARMNGPVTTVHVEGDLTSAEQQEVRRVVSRRLDGGMLHVRLDQLVDDVMALSWPREVHVRRVWPGILEVSVDREAVAARWGASGAVTTSGEIIAADGAITDRLPLLEAAHADGARTMQVYQRLRAVLARSELEIAALREDELAEWHLTLSNGLTVVLGREQLSQRLERFLIVYNDVLAERTDAVVSVDARYTNGIAVQWREGQQGSAGRQVANAPR
jgi:cell division protein FtsQ